MGEVVEVEVVDVEVVEVVEVGEAGPVVEIAVNWVVVELEEESVFELWGDFDKVVEGLALAWLEELAECAVVEAGLFGVAIGPPANSSACPVSADPIVVLVAASIRSIAGAVLTRSSLTVDTPAQATATAVALPVSHRRMKPRDLIMNTSLNKPGYWLSQGRDKLVLNTMG